MSTALTTVRPPRQLRQVFDGLPAVITDAGENASRRFVEFFTANIRNANTRLAYARAVARFCSWCQETKVRLHEVEPIIVATYVEQLTREMSAPSVKQHLAAIRMLFDYLVTGQIVPVNPAASVRGPKYVIKKGKTPVLTAAEARQLLDSIDGESLVGIRDKALIGVMVFSFARVGATIGMNVEDFYRHGTRHWLRLHEKGGKYHEVPAHHNVEEFLDMWINAAKISRKKKEPLFRSFNRRKQVTDRRLDRSEVWAMIKRRARKAGLPENICCHSFRATGITAYLENGGTLEKAQQIAAHESARTTKLYDRTSDEVSLDEIERIVIFGT